MTRRVPKSFSERLSEVEEFRRLRHVRLRHTVEVGEPLVLISQIQRSGGTLLSQLLDGHPECHAHPQEIHIGHPKKRIWPRLDLGDPSSWFDVLREEVVCEHLRVGYLKENAAGEVFPFLFSPSLLIGVFWTRLGTATSEAESGTVEEIERCSRRVSRFSTAAGAPTGHQSIPAEMDQPNGPIRNPLKPAQLQRSSGAKTTNSLFSRPHR